jgi:hypothetical protein
MLLSAKNPIRVISMVPSLTETLIAAGVPVVGRTRYCLHPANIVKDIPIVGGTKQARWERIRKLNPDFIVIDKEENPQEFLANSPIQAAVVHFTSVAGAGAEFFRLAEQLDSPELQKIGLRYNKLMPKTPTDRIDEQTVPGFIKWLRQPQAPAKKAVYLIWQDPWMTISRQTFIGSALDFLGTGAWFQEFAEKYPKIELTQFDPAETLLLCATEPFPFRRKNAEILSSPFSSALVDGESLSWFGIRNLEYLERFG